MTYNTKNWKRKNNEYMGYNTFVTVQRLRPLGSRVMALSNKCDSLALRTEAT